MTERLFDENAYLTEFSARIIDSKPENDGSFLILLNKTAFFPEGGGQFSDLGTLDDTPVTDVQEGKDGNIWHKCEKSFSAGETVTGKIDFTRRFDFMQQHSGEHIFSGIAHNRFGASNVGFHLGTDVVTIDLDVPLGESDIDMLETETNEAIYKNIPIEITYPSPEELKQIPYRSKKELTGKVRIVTIPGYDICACCGTHVAKTGEIGMVKIISHQNYKGGTRLTMLCGKRALLDYQRKNRDINKVTVGLSVKPEELCPAVERLENDITERKIYESTLRNELFKLKTASLSGEKALLFESGLSPDEIRCFCLSAAEKTEIAAVFCEKDGEWKYAVASKGRNCPETAKLLNSEFNGRGGGKPELVQGSCFGTKAEIENFFSKL